MPELPEVETVARGLRAALVGARGVSVTFYRGDIRAAIPTEDVKKCFVGGVVEAVVRRGKYLVLEMNGGNVYFHLGMTGRLLRKRTSDLDVAHTHAVFAFSGCEMTSKQFVHFVDPRRFGMIGCIPERLWADKAPFCDLGPEPLAGGRLAEFLYDQGRGKRQAVKAFLMDSRNVVGVGNIYACEALFLAKILPHTPVEKLQHRDMATVVKYVRQVLRASIKAGGTTFRDFADDSGNPGYHAVHLNVYGRNGNKCRKCDAVITVERLAGRSTFFCPKCQHAL